MPLEVDTTRTFDYVLIEDRPLPPDRQRALVFRHASARDYARIERAFREAFAGQADGGVDVLVAKVLDGVRVALVGWRGFADDAGADVPYDPAELDAVLQIGDVMDLNVSLLGLIQGDEADRKKAALRPPSGPAASADDGPAAGA